MKSLIFFILLSVPCMEVAAKDARSVTADACRKDAREEIDHVVKVICAKGDTYQLAYDSKRGNIVLTVNERTKILHKIPRARDPQLVGTDAIIGFLPDKLQPYIRQNIVVYFSSIRTNSGGGGGQCGSGAETYLNFLDIGQTIPRIRSSLLIGSCTQPIELVDQDMTRGKFGDITVVSGALSLDFLFYKDEKGDTNGTVSPDFKRLLFK